MNKDELLTILEQRFHQNMHRHENVDWQDVKHALQVTPYMHVLLAMEETGGQPDVVKQEGNSFWFYDCCKEMPQQRCSVCYDEKARNKRKTNKPDHSVESLLNQIQAELLTQQDYLYLQSLDDFDNKSQSWLKTDDDFYNHGEVLFANKRHGRTFIYYNGTQSYYSTRGFRTKVKI